MNILFFIPSYNDHDCLPDLVTQLLTGFPQARVLVVDDGSVQPIKVSVNSNSQQRLVVYRLECNQGLGLATGIALDYFLRQNLSFFVRLDADGQHPYDEVHKLLQPFLTKDADVVWAERKNATQPAFGQVHRSWAKSLTQRLAKQLLNSTHQDWFSGFFALNRRAALAVQTKQLERYCEVQMLCEFHSLGTRMQTIEIQQYPRTQGRSSIRTLGGLFVVLRACLLIVVHAVGRGRP
jgi:glycosyltransferase involved in cell wall biosynthesis